MEQILKLSNCPICDSNQIHNKKMVKDHMITQENFTIQECKDCGFWFTNPRPAENQIGQYYKSDVYVSHSSTNKGLINKMYNVVRNYTLKQKRKLIESLTEKRNLLDVGSGTGHFYNECSTNFWNVTGLEPDVDVRKFAANNFNATLKPIEELYLLPEKQFNVVTMWHVLEHVYHLKKDVAQIIKLIADDGYFIIAVPNRTSHDAEYYKEFWAGYDVPRHLYHFSEQDIKNLIEPHGLKFIKSLPMKFDSYYVSMLSEKYINGSIIKAFLMGLKLNRQAKKDGEYCSKIYVFKK